MPQLTVHSLTPVQARRDSPRPLASRVAVAPSRSTLADFAQHVCLAQTAGDCARLPVAPTFRYSVPDVPPDVAARCCASSPLRCSPALHHPKQPIPSAQHPAIPQATRLANHHCCSPTLRVAARPSLKAPAPLPPVSPRPLAVLFPIRR